jgi:mono/diheme cytochrome c family protein
MKWFFAGVVLMLGTACTPNKPATPAAPLTGLELIEHGHQVFLMNCASCHGSDPLHDGPVGPAIAGSATELIEARVLRAGYPAGYKPKRTSATMVALPHLQKEIPAIAAYLQSLRN